MKKHILISIVGLVAILGLFISCKIKLECCEYREWMDSVPYSETEYNPVTALCFKYLSNPLGHWSEINADELNIYSEDSTVTDQEIKVCGILDAQYYMSALFDFERERINGPHWDPSSSIIVNFDSTDHAIWEKLKSLHDDTVYMKGHLRLFKLHCNMYAGTYADCGYQVPGIFIYSADDITTIPYQDENK